MSIYSVSTRHEYAFGAEVEEFYAIAMKELPEVRWVIPDAYVDVENELYGGMRHCVSCIKKRYMYICIFEALCVNV
ncbi:multiple organellar RNA editing factor 8, chloroplastic/mitochondrial-like [Rhododendron vialii]|uniref:multiple organellar RNA editing factor 8, chloroplastic/mitochondrial-like n=1 Tax=Rhododendron vialii TaxID=182163 RepID=UPI00265E0E99|nr:multiple organellar RNA editing factor 8, chloroplastic/mitochondrial-like [Rhododendron vialii]